MERIIYSTIAVYTLDAFLTYIYRYNIVMNNSTEWFLLLYVFIVFDT